MSITIKRARKVVALCPNMSLVAEHDEAQQALVRAEQEGAGLEVNAAKIEAARRVQDVEARMMAETLHFTLEALARKAFAEFKLANPPRPGDDLDKSLGFSQAALDDLIIRSIVEVADADGEVVEFDPATEWTPLADELSEAQFQPFATAAFVLCAGVGDVPFSRSASLTIRRSARV